MNKAFPANINGKIFYIDEDAYNLLSNYLNQLHSAFTGPEGKEIVSDIECRISELFDEITLGGNGVISISDVNRIIEIMGRPEQLSDSDTDTHGCQGSVPPPYAPPVKKKLYRNENNKVFGGVISGLGEYLGWDVTLMRVLAVALTVCTYFWPCVLVYLVAWMVIPPAVTPQQKLEMMGEPVTVESIGETLRSTVSSTGSVLTQIVQVVATFVLGFFGLIGALAAFTLIVLSLCIIAGMVIFISTGSLALIDTFDLTLTSPYLSGWAMILLFMAVALPLILLAWAACTVIFKAPVISRGAIVAGLIFETAMIVGSVVLWNLV
ncbi:MAG: PspC domain-containing protein [Muribaculaceae bacterium]|nr:PspC domain-containing protein [Muribaculaceae bacterium]